MKSSMTSLHRTKLTHNALVMLVYLLRHLDDERDRCPKNHINIPAVAMQKK